MASMFKRAISEGSSIDKEFSKKSRNATKQITATGNSSPIEIERIENDYIGDYYKDEIINRKTAREALESLTKDPKKGLISDFKNLINGLGLKGKEEFIEYLFEKYSKINFKNLFTEKITLKSGDSINVFKINKTSYARLTKSGLRFYKIKNNQFAKMPRSFLKILRDREF